MNFTFDMTEIVRGIKDAVDEMHDNAQEAAEAVNDWWLGEAKDLAPFLEGFLTSDIAGEVFYDGKVAYSVVYVPSNATSSQYAIRMHEGFYNLGKKSVSKQAKVGKTVGRHFITRPLDYGRDKMREILIETMKM